MTDNVRIIEVEGPLGGADLERLAQVNQAIFGFNETAENLGHCFGDKRSVLLLLALRGEEPVAFKVGFSDEPGSFESWRGGVVESARRLGLARRLMDQQHKWCANQGFRVIKTTTNGDNPAMLILNLQSGFRVVGTFVNRMNRVKVLQEKCLDG